MKKKKIKKAISFLLTTTMTATVCTGLALVAFAADITATATANPETITSSDSSQTVAVSISLSEPIALTAYSAEVAVPEGWSTKAADVKANIGNAAGTGTAGTVGAGFANNKIGKTFEMGYGKDEDQFAQLTGFTINYTVPANAAVGSQQVGLKELEITGMDGSVVITGVSAVDTVTVSATSVQPIEGYTVALSSDAPSAGVAKGSSFNVNLDVANSEATAFNAFYSVLSYDSTKLSYTGEKTVGDFTVDTNEVGKMKITRTGKDAAIGETPELTLPFQAVAAGEAALELTKANVDSQANAEIQNAPDATVSGSPLTVKVLETYTIIFAGGDGATGTAPAMDPAVEGHKFALPEAGDLKKDGFTFSGWNDGTDNYKAGAEYTMPAKDVTFTAQWTENVTATPASANPSAYFGSQYKLIAATINASGYIPTYDGNEMFLVQGYEDNTYYYVIDGTYDSSKFSYKEGTATTIAKPDYDVNQTKLVDINDAQFVYNIYNGISPTQNIVQRLLLADTNRDQTVGTQDCAVVVQNIA